MEFENTFSVDAPVDKVWDLLLDVERVAPCMPGAEVLERQSDDAYKVAIKIKLGPMTMNYKGDVEIVGKDAASHAATMRAKAREARGQGTAQADVKMSLRGENGGTTASILTDLQMSGRAAAMGRGVIRDVAASLTDTFARNLAEMVSAQGRPPAPEVPAEPRAAAPARAEPPRAEAPPESALSAGQVAASVLAARMRDPRSAGLLGLALLLLGIAIGRRTAR
jgi:carbon monoxide dehydrogenase subunit G